MRQPFDLDFVEGPAVVNEGIFGAAGDLTHLNGPQLHYDCSQFTRIAFKPARGGRIGEILL